MHTGEANIVAYCRGDFIYGRVALLFVGGISSASCRIWCVLQNVYDCTRHMQPHLLFILGIVTLLSNNAYIWKDFAFLSVIVDSAKNGLSPLC